MNDDQALHELLRQALPPVGAPDLPRDLWPQLLRRMDERPPLWSRLDWALAALLAAWILLFPETIPALFYHL